MPTVGMVTAFLERFAPLRLAESWDNVGLLVGDPRREAGRVMTCLTVTPRSAAEAIEHRADLIITHHPLPFQPLPRLTADSTVGRLLLDLVAARTAVYSPHTAFDSAAGGINQQLAEGLGLRGVTPLRPHEEGQGVGRCGWLPEPAPLAELAVRLKKFLALQRLQMVGPGEQPVRMVAVACGAAHELLPAARQAGCDALVLGEARFHTCLEAEACGVGLLLPGHYASERFAIESLAAVVARQFSGLECWASREERDPLRWVE
ncbi:MAG: Nif3-like dinuclear metal center hexameric protein [Thermoguttaceae bacterium]